MTEKGTQAFRLEDEKVQADQISLYLPKQISFSWNDELYCPRKIEQLKEVLPVYFPGRLCYPAGRFGQTDGEKLLLQLAGAVRPSQKRSSWLTNIPCYCVSTQVSCACHVRQNSFVLQLMSARNGRPTPKYIFGPPCGTEEPLTQLR